MVLVNVKAVNGGKAKAARVSQKQRSAATARSGVQAAARVRPAVMGARGEHKFFDTIRASHAPGQTGAISNLSLNLIPQGVTESTRVGRKCVLTKIMLRGTCAQPTTANAGETGESLRIILYQDKQANGATAAVTGILSTATFESFNNLSNSQRFIILSDKLIDLNIPSGGGTTEVFGEVVKHWEMFKDVNIPIEFTGTSGAITTITSNNIGVLAITKSGEGVLNYVSRVRFSDN